MKKTVITFYIMLSLLSIHSYAAIVNLDLLGPPSQEFGSEQAMRIIDEESEKGTITFQATKLYDSIIRCVMVLKRDVPRDTMSLINLDFGLYPEFARWDDSCLDTDLDTATRSITFKFYIEEDDWEVERRIFVILFLNEESKRLLQKNMFTLSCANKAYSS